MLTGIGLTVVDLSCPVAITLGPIPPERATVRALWPYSMSSAVVRGLVPNLTVFLADPVLFVPLSAVLLVPGRSRPVVRMATAFAVRLTKLGITVRGQIQLLSSKGASVGDTVMILG